MKGGIAFIFIAVLLTFGCSKSGGPGDGTYWGHGFGMGYGMGCYEDSDDMMRDLGISGAQTDKIAEIDARYRKQYYENRGDFDKIDALRQKHRKEIDDLLNDSQRSKFGNVYDRSWGGWGRGYGRRHMGDYYGSGYGMGYCAGLYSSSDYMREDLNLTDEQVKKINDIDGKYRDLYYKNRNDFNKTDSLRIEHRREIDKILKPEQRKRFSESYENRWRGWGHGRGMGPGMMGY